MSANVDLVRSMYPAFELGDYRSVEWAHPDMEFVIVDGPSPGNWTGSAGIAEGWGRFLSAWEEYRCYADEYRELDSERVLVLAHFSARGKRSDLDVGQISTKTAHLFEVHGGKVAKLVVYLDRERALADLGLAPDVNSP
jgi:ketosteroid isomerase-like protein